MSGQKQRCWDHNWSRQPGFISGGKMKRFRKWPNSKQEPGAAGVSGIQQRANVTLLI